MENLVKTCFGGAYSDKRVLVTGHTGFKGSWLVVWLLQLGAEVCGYSKDIPTEPSLFEAAGVGSRVHDVRGHIEDYLHFKSVLDEFKPDFVFHFAAQAIVSTSYRSPLETFSTNVMGTAAVLEAVRGVTWPLSLVLITSDKAYDNVEWPWGYRENDPVGGKDPYSGSKGGAELAIKAWFESFLKHHDAVRLAIARAGNVIGGGDWAKDRIVADCVRAWMADRTVEIRSPRATRPWQHVLEPLSGYLALGAELASRSELSGEAFNFGPRADQNASVVELLSDLAQIWGFENPEASYQVTADIPFHEAGLLKLNIDKALLRLQWVPNYTYDECVAATASWYRDVCKRGHDALEKTASQIEDYQRLAKVRNRKWA